MSGVGRSVLCARWWQLAAQQLWECWSCCRQWLKILSAEERSIFAQLLAVSIGLFALKFHSSIHVITVSLRVDQTQIRHWAGVLSTWTFTVTS